MPRRKYLQEETFEKWKANEYAHTIKTLAEVRRFVFKLKGKLSVLIPLVIGILHSIAGLYALIFHLILKEI